MRYSKKFYQIKSNEIIFNLVQSEIDEIGYYNLSDQDTSSIKKYAISIKKKYIAVIRIGGSTLGTYAIYNFLKKSNTSDIFNCGYGKGYVDLSNEVLLSQHNSDS